MTQFTLIVAVGPWDPEPWRARFEAAAGGRPVHLWPQDGDLVPTGPYVICAWKAGTKVFELYNAPRAVFSLGAGVDHLASIADRKDFPVYRVVDADLTLRMAEYVAFGVLYLHRQIPAYLAHQQANTWRDLDQCAASEVRVGMMGVGVMGEAGGRALQALGFDVVGWARSPKPAFPFKVFAGREALGAFLEDIDVLVNVLPNTPDTAGLINRDVFAQLGRKRGTPSYFVNAGRGETAVEDDVVAALQSGRLSGAVLDVFKKEPLPAESPLWAMRNVLITPHVAADSNPNTIIPKLMSDVAQLERGEVPPRTVDLARGY